MFILIINLDYMQCAIGIGLVAGWVVGFWVVGLAAWASGPPREQEAVRTVTGGSYCLFAFDFASYVRCAF